MRKFVLGGCVAIWMVIGGYAPAAQAETSPPRPAQVAAAGDDAGPLSLPDVSKIDPRLVFLGAGVLAGLVIASPSLELSEVFGIALGVIGSQYLYYSLAPHVPGNLRPNP